MTGEFNGTTVTGFALRDIKYTSFDQPKTITHLGAAALSSDQGQLDDGTSAWDQQCTINFYFGPGLQRLIQKKVKGKLITTTLSLGGYEIREVTGHTGTVIEREERSHFGNGVRVMRWLGAKGVVQPQASYEFAAKDHLGNDTATFDGQGQLRQQRGHLKPGEVQKTERQSYDAWGARRDGDTSAPASGQLNKLTPTEATMTSPSQSGGAPSGSPPERAGSNLPRGYTGHEMLDDVGLIHMNGRLYDSALGRMCAADPYVQSTEAIQNYNRYSYVMNNPMNATDPSGLSWLSKWWKVIVAVIIAIIIAIVAAYLMGALLNALGGALGIGGAAGGAGGTAAAAAGATIGTSGITATGFGIIAVGAGVQAGMTAYSMTKGGASFGSILKAVVVSAAISGATAAISANALHGLGEAVGSYGSGVTDAAFAEAATKGGFAVTGNMVVDRTIGTIVHGAAHGVVGGAAAAAQGGSFKSGFISAVVSFGVDVIGIQTLGGNSGGLYDMKNRSPQAVIGRTAIAAISGGLASVATGGKFTQAAFTAGFMHLFNTGLAQSMYGADAEANINAAQAEVDGFASEVGAGLVDATVTTGAALIPVGRIFSRVGKMVQGVYRYFRPLQTISRSGTPAISSAVATASVVVARTALPEGSILLGVVKNGEVIKTGVDFGSSHAGLAASAKVLVNGALEEGVHMVTIMKHKGSIFVQNSQTYHGNMGNAPKLIYDAVLKAFQ